MDGWMDIHVRIGQLFNYIIMLQLILILNIAISPTKKYYCHFTNKSFLLSGSSTIQYSSTMNKSSSSDGD